MATSSADPNATVDMTGLYQALMNGVDPSQLPPVPQEGPYGAPATETDVGQQSSNAPNPLAVALSGGQPGGVGSAQSSPAATAPPQTNFLASLLGGGRPTTGSRYNPQTGEFLPQGSYSPPAQQPMPAAAPAPSMAPPATAPIAGKVSDIGETDEPAEDATAQRIRSIYENYAAQHDQLLNLARATAGTPASAEYLKQAEKLETEADKWREKYIDYTTPEDTSTAEQHNYEYGLTHPGFNKPPKTTEITNFEYAQQHPGFPTPGQAPRWEETGTDIYGRPMHGWVTPPQPGAAPNQPAAAPAPVPTNGPYGAPSTSAPAPASRDPFADAAGAIADARSKGLAGEDLIKTLPPQIADHVRAVIAGDEPMLEAGVAGYKPLNQLINDAVRAAVPGTSPADFAARLQAKKDVAPGGKDQQSILKMDSAIGHSTEALAAGKDIGNTGSSTVNWLEDQAFPSSAPVSQKVSQFNSVASLSGPELQSIYTPSGGAEQERQGQARQMNAYMSPEEMEAVHASRVRAAAERVVAFDKQYRDAMGQNQKPWTGLSQPTVEQLQRYANDRLPPQFQAKDANGNVLPPATVNNGFTWRGTTPAHSPSLLDQARQHPLAAGVGAAGAGVALGMAPAGVAAVGGSALARALAAGAGGYYLGHKLLP